MLFIGAGIFIWYGHTFIKEINWAQISKIGNKENCIKASASNKDNSQKFRI